MIGQTISHYRIVEKLGEGGMGVVYKAHDTKLDRDVAMKFLPPELTRDQEARQRFIHEAQVASALQHPNICTIHDIDEADDGRIFIVMDCYEGEPLRLRIVNLVPSACASQNAMSQGGCRGMPIEEAVDIAIQVAQGLQKAHEKGIAHRDIKPGNVIITTDGVAKIVDFGLAKLAGQAKLTRTGSTVGTAAYMSPEQARGLDVDNRTDIWSLGVVLFEMLTGKLPFRGEHEAAVLYSIVHEEPAQVLEYRLDVPVGLALTVSRALQKEPGERYQSMKELVKDLESISSPGVQPPKQEKSILVLPFEDLSPDHDQEYFSDGLTEEIISDLSTVLALRVISRSSAMTFKGTKKKVPDIAREVNVQYVLEGSVRKAGNNLRITAQLIEALNDAHLWAAKYSGTLDDVFEIQEKVSRSILDAMKLKLTLQEDRRMSEKPMESGAAYECYLRAKHECMQFSTEGIARALKDLQYGLDMIGDNALLFAGLGFAHVQMVNMGIGQQEHLEEARKYVQRAFSLDKQSAPANFVLGIVLILEGRTKDAFKYLKQSLARDPGDADTAVWLSWSYLLEGKIETPRQLSERYVQRDPINPMWQMLDGIVNFMSGRFDLATEGLGRSYNIMSDLLMHRFWYALSLAYAGRFQECTSLLEPCTVAAPTEDSWINLGKFLNFVLTKDLAGITSLLTTGVLSTFKRDCQYSYHAAAFFSYLGERDLALDWLENSVERGMFNYPMFSEYDPFLKSIRGEERFKKLMERVKREWEEFDV